MEKNSCCKVILFLIVFGFSVQCAQTGPVLLKENFGARAMGMGDAYVTLGDDVFGMQYNPALLTYLRGRNIAALYMPGIADNYSGYIGYVEAPKIDGYLGKSRGLILGAGFSTLQGGSMEINNLDGTSVLVDSESDFLFSLSAALNISEPLSIGLTAKYLTSRLVGQYNASAFALDAGAIFDLSGIVLPNLLIGASLQNIGTQMKYISALESLPLYLRTGVSYKYIFEDKSVLSTAFETDYFIGDTIKYSAGVEYAIDNCIFIRAGCKIGNDINGLTLGTGLRLGGMQLDYGMGFISEFNGILSKMSISYNLDYVDDHNTIERSPSKRHTPAKIIK
jgi:hypothetical protein